MLSHLLRELILPPGCLLILATAGLLILKKKPRLGQGLMVGVLVVWYLLSIPLVSMWLSKTTENRPALSLTEVEDFRPQAIIILGNGVDFHAPEYEGKTVAGAGTLKRLNYGAHLAKQLNLPIIVTGGYGDTRQDTEAYAMSELLTDWGFQNVFVEDESQNTVENALFSKKIADREGLRRVLVVTSASHVARAEGAFAKAGFEVKVAPTGFRSRQPWERGILLLIPSHSQFDASADALRVHLAALWYKIRY
jgi:uncharacterized SAM-binding protein YcdF (DUF218 family)